jgi:hypothetical protein
MFDEGTTRVHADSQGAPSFVKAWLPAVQLVWSLWWSRPIDLCQSSQAGAEYMGVRLVARYVSIKMPSDRGRLHDQFLDP